MKIIKGKTPAPRRTLLYACHGIGKSTWAAQAPACLILNLEDGLNDIDCHKTQPLTSLEAISSALTWLATMEHKFKHVAIDSADWLESLIHKEVARKAGKDFADIGYGAGYKAALKYWDEITFKLDWLRAENGIGVIMLAHTAVKKYQDPEQDSYDRYMPALHDSASALLMEWSDDVLFGSYKVFVRKEDLGFNKNRGIAVGGEERFIRTRESAAALAKNRLEGMPAEIGFSWAEYAAWFPENRTAVSAEVGVSVSSVSAESVG